MRDSEFATHATCPQRLKYQRSYAENGTGIPCNDKSDFGEMNDCLGRTSRWYMRRIGRKRESKFIDKFSEMSINATWSAGAVEKQKGGATITQCYL